MAVCVVAVSGAGSAAATQAGDVWTELGEDFIGSGSGAENSTIEGNMFVLPMSGAEVVIVEGLEPEDSEFEDQLVINTPQGMGAVGALQGFGSPQTVMETYANAFGDELDGAIQIDSRTDGDFASGLYSVDLLGVSLFMFITVDTVTVPGFNTIQVALAETDIAGAITMFRESVAINGQPMFDGVDELEVQELADAYQG